VTQLPPGSHLKAVLGPTNTGKTHYAIERLCGHSSGAIGFPLRLLAREVYDRVCAIKGAKEVALITGEERIEPPGARWFLCTAEAMPVTRGDDARDLAFVALDEAQLSADRERGHIFTDRLLNARGREETMLLGSSSLEPLIRSLEPRAEISTRPRFSTLSHLGARKLSRLPPRSAIVAFSAEQVYATAEMLRRFRGGAAVVMGALSPETRNRQVELFQSGEVDYIVATDAIGMGLNLDVRHVAFASLSKFDGVRKRRLTPAEMAQIAGRAGRHQTDGTFGTLAGGGGNAEFTEEEIYAIEEHRFAPLTKLYWRDPEPRLDNLDVLIADLEAGPQSPELVRAPEAIDLAVLKRLAEDPAIADSVQGPGMVRRFWEACRLPDFRSQGADMHARFVARLWQDLKSGHLGADFVAARIAELDRPQGDIDALQGRIAAVRSWAYICQRPDWVLARDEMAARARAAEARLSDALHGALTSRFVNRRTAVLMKAMGKDPKLLNVSLGEDDTVLVEGQAIGRLEGFRFVVEQQASHDEQRMMLAAAEKHLPGLLAARAQALIATELGDLRLADGAIHRGETKIANLERGKSAIAPRIVLSRELAALDPAQRDKLAGALEVWLADRLAPLAPLAKLEEAAASEETGSEVRALLRLLLERAGSTRREDAGLLTIPKEKRPLLRRLGIVIGALDVFMPAMLKPGPRLLLKALELDRRPVHDSMQPVIACEGAPPAGYRKAGGQCVRLDMAERLLREAFDSRAKPQGGEKARRFAIDDALATSTGLLAENREKLLGQAGFRLHRAPALGEGAFGPPAPDMWSRRLPRPERQAQRRPARSDDKARKPGKKPPRKDARGDGGKGRGAKTGAARRTDRAPRPPAGAPATGKALAGLADLLKKS
jgi:ATP-dependent RNA helicase SUPV3L1/SUV3